METLMNDPILLIYKTKIDKKKTAKEVKNFSCLYILDYKLDCNQSCNIHFVFARVNYLTEEQMIFKIFKMTVNGRSLKKK